CSAWSPTAPGIWGASSWVTTGRATRCARTTPSTPRTRRIDDLNPASQEGPMIYELRTYTFQPGKQGEYLKLNLEVGRKVRGDKYGKFEGGWTTEFGMLNQYVHLWAYPDLNERDRLRGELAKNEEWTKGYVPQIRPLLMAQENKILSAVTPFKPPTASGNIYEQRWDRAQGGRLGEGLNLPKGGPPSAGKSM